MIDKNLVEIEGPKKLKDSEDVSNSPQKKYT